MHDVSPLSEKCKVAVVSTNAELTDPGVNFLSTFPYLTVVNFTCEGKGESVKCEEPGQKLAVYCDKGESPISQFGTLFKHSFALSVQFPSS